jgi:hypothetical protein
MGPAMLTKEEPDSQELAALCGEHLRQEGALLTAALAIVRGVQVSFSERGIGALIVALTSHHQFAKLIEEMKVRRQRCRAELTRLLDIEPKDATLTRALARLPVAHQASMAEQATRVRAMATELAGLNYRVSVHLRVHIDAYRRILRDLTNTAVSSGRYGPAGKTELQDYRPLIHIRG